MSTSFWHRWLRHESMIAKRARVVRLGRSGAHHMLRLEPLEDRCLLSFAAGLSSSVVASLPMIALKAHATSSPVGGGYTPAQIRQVYGFDQIIGLLGNNYNYAGEGQTIAIIDWNADPTIASDLKQFDKYYNIGGAANDPDSLSFFKVVNQDGGSTPPGLADFGEGSEQALDVEWAHALAPAANILLVEADSPSDGDLNTAILYAAKQPMVSVVSMSFGIPESATDHNYAGIYTTPAGHQGVSFVAASGDTGAPPKYPSADRNVLAVGGTTLPADNSGNPSLALESGWSGSSGGISAFGGQPIYQKDIVTQSKTSRATPDVAYDGDGDTGFPVYDSYTSMPGLPWHEIGGTSAGAPQWAALIAIADQARVTAGEATLDGPSQLLPALYHIARIDPGAFNDITSGTSTGDPNNSAGPGYDLVTGLGTPNAQVLVPELVNAFSSYPIPTTLYWTGDVSENWDDPGNWSNVDPKVTNLPEDVLPGPNDNIVIDIHASVHHSDYSYDTISSLTLTGGGALYLERGTLDLSGSGAAGTFQAPGKDANGFGLVFMDGGELANANVTKDTIITVDHGSKGSITGGVWNGTLHALSGSIMDLAGRWTNSNTGTVTADPDSVLILGDTWDATLDDPEAATDTWVNMGTITTTEDPTSDHKVQVFLGGWLTYDPSMNNLATLDLSTAIVSLIGTLDNSPADNPGTAGVLTLSPGTTSSTGCWDLLGGRIEQGTLSTTGGAALTANQVGGTLDGVTVDDGSVDVSNSAIVTFEGQGWSNSGTIAVSDSATLNLYGSWINYGNMTVNSAPDSISTVSLGTHAFYQDINPTSAAASPYTWINNGFISIPDTSTVNLGGVFTTAAFKALMGDLNSFSQNLAGDTFNLTGVMDNSAADNPFNQNTLALSSSTVLLNLSGGEIYQGAITTSGSYDLVATANGGILDGVTLDGTLDMSEVVDGYVIVSNDLTLNGTIKLGGESSTSDGAQLYFDNGAHVDQTIGGTGTITFGQDANGDLLENLNNADLTFGPNLTIQGGRSGSITSIGGAIDNLGTIEENTSGGTLSIDFLANYSAGTLTGGTWKVSGGGALDLHGMPVTTNAATIAVSGASSHLYSDDASTDALATLTANAGNGRLTVGSDYTLKTASDFSNSGNVTVDSGGSFSTGSYDYTQSAGTTKVNGTLSAANVILNGGFLKGTGTIQAQLSNGATLDPVDDPSTLTLQGDYTQTGAGVLDIEIASLNRYGQLAVSGAATLGGTLNVSLLNGFIPRVGDALQILTSSQVSGGFAAMNGLNLGNGDFFSPGPSRSGVLLTVLPPGRIYWTGDGGDANWDDAGNWSEVDPAVTNTPEFLLPTPSSDVVIDLDGQTINHSATNGDTINSLVVTGHNVTLNLSGGTLDLSGSSPRGTFQVDQQGDVVNLQGGVLKNADVTSSTTIVASSSGGTLDGVRLDGALDMSQVKSNRAYVINGLALNGTVKLGGIAGANIGAELHIGRVQDNLSETISGTGNIQFGQEASVNYLYNDSNETVTFGPNVTVLAGLNSQIGALGSSCDNQGTIVVDGNIGGTLSLDGAWINDGFIEDINGGNVNLSGGWSNSVGGRVTVTEAVLTLDGHWTNSGTIAATDAALYLSGSWTNYGTITAGTSTISSLAMVSLGDAGVDTDPTSAAAAQYVWTNLGTISIADGWTVNLGGVFNSDFIAYLQSNGANLAKDVVNLTGTMDNSAAHNPNGGGILALNASTGPLYLVSGRVYRGEITTNGNNDLILSSPYGTGTLDGMHLAGTLDMSLFHQRSQSGDFATVLVLNGLTLDGTIKVGRSGGSLVFGSPFDRAAQTIDGTGTIQGGASVLQLYNYSSKTLTIGPNITIHGAANTLLDNPGGATLDNRGTIIEDFAAGAGMAIVNWVNNGSIQVGNGARLTLEGPTEGQGGTNSTAGRITATGATLLLYDTWTNHGSIAVDPTSVVELGSRIDFDPTDAAASTYYWSNPGTISIAAGAGVHLGGIFTTDGLNGLIAKLAANGQSLANDTLNLTGTLDNSAAHNPVSGGVLALGASTGPLYLVGGGGVYDGASRLLLASGRIYQGTITTSGGDDLLPTPYGPSFGYSGQNIGTLDGVTLDGTLDMTQPATTDVLNGLTLSGTIKMGGGSALNVGAPRAGAALTVAGTGTIQFGLNSKGGGLMAISGSATLNGTLNVTLLNGYTPNVGASFKILTFASRFGNFAAMNGLKLANGDFLTPVFTAGDLTLVVTKGTMGASTVALSATGASGVVYGQTVTYTASVRVAGSSTSAPTGTVQLQVDGSNFGTPVPLSGASARLNPKLPAGHHVVMIVYSGDSNFLSSSGTLMGGEFVTPAPLTITATNQSMVYGGPRLPALTAIYSGFVNGDTAARLTTQPTRSTTASAKSHVGKYAITVGAAYDPNYTIGYVNGTLTINPARLTITAVSKTMTYGGALPPLTVTYAGLVNGDTPATFASRAATAPRLSTVPATSPAGTYAITMGAVDDPDYVITYVYGRLTIMPIMRQRRGRAFG